MGSLLFFKEFFAGTVLYIICFGHLLSKTNTAGCIGGLKVPAAHLYSARSMLRTGVELRSREQMASHPLAN